MVQLQLTYYTSVVVSCPSPNMAQRDKIVSQIKKLAEETKIAIRNIRKKIRQKDKEIEKPLQVLTDQFIEKVDLLMGHKIDTIKY